MPKSKTYHSMHVLVLAAFAAALVFFAAVFYGIMRHSMSSMLGGFEMESFVEHARATERVIETLAWHTRSAVREFARRGRTSLFVLHSTPYEPAWPANWNPPKKDFDFIVIKNYDGENLTSEFYGRESNEPTAPPAGFFAHLGKAMRGASASIYAQKDESATVRDGFMIHAQNVYYVCMAAVLRERRPVGMVAMGYKLDLALLHGLTHVSDTVFTPLLPDEGEKFPKGAHADETSNFTFITLPGLSGNQDVVLKISHPRHVYSNGMQIMEKTTFMLMAVMAAFAASLYLLIVRYALAPIKRLSANVAVKARECAAGVMPGAVSREVYRLCWAINDMMDNLETSRSCAERAEKFSRTKSMFLACMSHEIRTPMNVISGLTRMARKSDSPERRDYCLKIIDEASSYMLSLLNGVLDLSRIESGEMEMEKAAFSPQRALRHALSLFQVIAAEKWQTLNVDISPDIPRAITGDEKRLTQVLANLLSNAMKFTPEAGVISLSASMIKENGGKPMLLVQVRDSGAGLSEEDDRRLLALFNEKDFSISKRFGGSGLGLVICKRMVGLMGGRIWVESEPGQGCLFSFTVPAEAAPVAAGWEDLAARAHGPGDMPPQFPGKTVLVAEHHEINREIALFMLEGTGTTVHTAGDGETALRMAHDNPGLYDLILLDVNMPLMDGFELARRIRALPGGALPPLVGVTSSVFKEDLEKCRECGMNAHISKPIKAEVFYEILRRFLGKDHNFNYAPQERRL